MTSIKESDEKNIQNIDEIKIKELDLELIQPSTKTFHDPEQGGSKTIVVGKPGCFIKGTPVLMFNGEIKNVENVKVGELVMGPDSKPRTVLELCRNRDEMFKIIPEYGEPYTVNLMHKLVLKDKGIFEITVQEYEVTLWSKRPKILRTGVQFREKRLSIPPYTYGRGLFGEFKDENTQVQNFFNNNDLTSNPRILRDFKINSIANRKRLLEGILDNSGVFYDREKNTFTLTCDIDILREDICFLSRSLGLVAKNTNNRVEITGDFSNYTFNVYKNLSKPTLNYLESEFKTEFLGEDDYYGFTIDGDHRFLLGTFEIVRNTGKCLAKGTPVMLFNGNIEKVENIKEGELLMGDDSKPRKVLNTCKGVDTMYKISQKNGDNYTVNSPHILSLISNGNNRIKKGTKLDIAVSEFIKKSKNFQKGFCGYKAPVDFSFQKVELDPYLLGYWLGDGTSDSAMITTTDTEVLNYFRKKLPEMGLMLKQKKQDPISYRIIQEDRPKKFKNQFLNFLRNNNLLNNKHVPTSYKINNRETRLQLLAGILDADAWYDSKGNCYDFVQKNEKLIDDVIFICRSLGFSANKKGCFKSCFYKGEKKTGNYFRCHIAGNVKEIPLQIFRKKGRGRKSNKNHLATQIEIENIGEGEYYGFQLDGNHRFLLGDFTVTHNTTLIASLLYAKKHIFPVAMAMSGTEDSNHFYRSVLPSTFVFNNYDEQQVEKFIKRQKIAKDHLENPWAVIILDDCTDDPSLFRKPLQNGMYKRGRHWKMWYILSLQYGMDVRPVIRTNVDGVFILREPNMRNRKVMYENYASVIPDFKLFCDILDQITNDYTALYIHNATRSNDWRECVYWYKAKPIPSDFKFGSEEYWNFHYQRYNPEYIDPITV